MFRKCLPLEAKVFDHFCLERRARVLDPPLRQMHTAEPAVQEPTLRIELDRLFHDRLRLVEEARAKALRPKAPLGTHAEGIEHHRASSQRDRLLAPPNAPPQSRGA